MTDVKRKAITQNFYLHPHAGELLDSICESNRSYFESGIKTGYLLLMQLLDL